MVAWVCLFLVFLLPTINLAKFYYLGNLADGFSVDFWELLTNLMSVHGLFCVDGYGSFGYSFVYYSWFINRPPFISTNVICSGNLTELRNKYTNCSSVNLLFSHVAKIDIVILRSAKTSTKFEKRSKHSVRDPSF